jgi:hypothetical protein
MLETRIISNFSHKMFGRCPKQKNTTGDNPMDDNKFAFRKKANKTE